MDRWKDLRLRDNPFVLDHHTNQIPTCAAVNVSLHQNEIAVLDFGRTCHGLHGSLLHCRAPWQLSQSRLLASITQLKKAVLCLGSWAWGPWGPFPWKRPLCPEELAAQSSVLTVRPLSTNSPFLELNWTLFPTSWTKCVQWDVLKTCDWAFEHGGDWYLMWLCTESQFFLYPRPLGGAVAENQYLCV